MAGHSKWANIQHRKGVQDKKRGKLFTRLIRELSVAARLGLPDPAANPRLRAAMDGALAANISKDTIQRAIKRASGEGDDGAQYEEVRYEGYGPGGVAVMVDCLTDNRNRTVAEVRHTFAKCGGNLGTGGSVSYLFNKMGVIGIAAGQDEDQVMEVALEGGAEDVVSGEDGSIEVLTSPENFPEVSEALRSAGLEPEYAEVTMRASTSAGLGLDDARTMVKLLEMLEELDDVQQVYSNADISEAIMAQL
jgi:YebC/PmpR family DNA-binding regulatory protein